LPKETKINLRELKMNTTTKSVLGNVPAMQAADAATNTSTKTLASWVLASGVAALVVLADHLIDDWADTHVMAAWAALWVVAVVAIAALRGVSRLLAQNLMVGLDGWSAHVARRRADERLWAMAQTDSRLMQDLQLAMDRYEDVPAKIPSAKLDLTTYVARRTPRMINNFSYYI
jgi:hypothetical protein